MKISPGFFTLVTFAFAPGLLWSSPKSRQHHAVKTSYAARSSHPVEAPAKFDTVVVDPGHGGFDPGGIEGNLLPEKDVSLDIARRLSYVLEDAGLKCVLTRDDDYFVTLEDRVKIANAESHAIFVSIHCNAAPRKEARGVETYYSTTTGGAALASRIQQNLVATTDGENRGVKPASYYVLRKNNDLAVLVECGFLTNPEDAELAKDDDYRQKVAEQICAAIVDYRNSLP